MSESAKGRSPIVWVVILVVVALLGVVGYYSYRGYKGMMRRKAMMKDVLPTFKHPDPNAKRAPTTKVFGLHIGFTNLTQAKAFLKERKIACKDTSIRALMKLYRKKKLAAMKKKNPDAVSKASMTKRSKRERNPQVRMSCEKLSSKAIKDEIKRPDVLGRMLLIFDSPKHALRHLSYAYNAKHLTGIRALKGLLAHYTKIYGKPHKSESKFPAITASMPKNTVVLKKYNSISFTWNFGDLRIYLKVMSLGTWVSVLEELEVPLGIYPDAPAKRSAAKQP